MRGTHDDPREPVITHQEERGGVVKLDADYLDHDLPAPGCLAQGLRRAARHHYQRDSVDVV